MADPTASIHALLEDSFGRINGLVASVCDGLDQVAALYRPDASANSVAWLVWHQSRVLDDHVSDLADAEQVWLSGDWAERFDLPLDPEETGYGHNPEQVSAVDVDPRLLVGYHRDVHEATLRYVRRLDAAELDRVVDENWDPPVTAGARLVSVIGDCLQHLGQASYVRGLAERA